MTWNKKYWDIVERYYWTLKDLGLKSISLKELEQDDTNVLLPKKVIDIKKPVYQRHKGQTETLELLRTKEEPLNEVFDITFAIAPDMAVKRLFLDLFSFEDDGAFESLGRDIRNRYGFGVHENVTQHDGYFVSDKTLLGVELKLRSKTSPEQVLKYAYLMMLEEQNSNTFKDNLGLLFIRPISSITKTKNETGFAFPCVQNSKEYLDSVIETGKLNKKITTAINSNKSHYISVLERLNFKVISWFEFNSSISLFLQNEDDSNPLYTQTINRLFDGLQNQIEQTVFKK